MRPWTSLSKLRGVTWSKSTDWDVRFKGAPAPFDDWFPASVASLNLATLETQSFSLGQTTTSIPSGTSEFTLNLTFYDTDELVLTHWIADHINTNILNNGEGIATVSEAGLEADFALLDHTGKIKRMYNLTLIPTGEITPDFQSKSSEYQISVNFIIVGQSVVKQ